MQKGKISSTKGQTILIVGFVGYMGSVILQTSAVYHRGVSVFIYVFTQRVQPALDLLAAV